MRTTHGIVNVNINLWSVERTVAGVQAPRLARALRVGVEHVAQRVFGLIPHLRLYRTTRNNEQTARTRV